MAAPVSFESHHQDMIHDCQPDYYGKRLATCSSDRTIKIFDLETKQRIADLQGHEGPVWQITWSHPKFGSLLASCGYDNKVLIWRETPSQNQPQNQTPTTTTATPSPSSSSSSRWEVVYEHTTHSSSVNSVAWAPHEFGLVLACGSSDSSISILKFVEGQWQAFKFVAHAMGCNAVSWAPFSGDQTVHMLASAGCDNTIKLWLLGHDNTQSEQAQLRHHSDWVRDVSWAPNIGSHTSTIASCSQDRTCVIWTKEGEGEWKAHPLPKFAKPVWRVSWSITGNILAVSGGDNRVTLWKQSNTGEWAQVSSVNDGAVSTTNNSTTSSNNAQQQQQPVSPAVSAMDQTRQ